jgi:protein SCO1/2
LENFALTNTHGERMQLAELRGKYLLLFFGYTYCPDVCPTTLADLSRAVQALGAKAEQVQVIMVSVDPERDTPQRLGAHLAAFDPSFIGLTGTPEQVSALATAFGIFYEKHEGSPATSYLVDHTASVTLVDPEGYVRMLFPFNTSGQGIAADLLPLLH